MPRVSGLPSSSFSSQQRSSLLVAILCIFFAAVSSCWCTTAPSPSSVFFVSFAAAQQKEEEDGGGNSFDEVSSDTVVINGCQKVSQNNTELDMELAAPNINTRNLQVRFVKCSFLNVDVTLRVLPHTDSFAPKENISIILEDFTMQSGSFSIKHRGIGAGPLQNISVSANRVSMINLTGDGALIIDGQRGATAEDPTETPTVRNVHLIVKDSTITTTSVGDAVGIGNAKMSGHSRNRFLCPTRRVKRLSPSRYLV